MALQGSDRQHAGLSQGVEGSGASLSKMSRRHTLVCTSRAFQPSLRNGSRRNGRGVATAPQHCV